MFFKKVEKFCIHCKRSLESNAVKPLCKSCSEKEK